MRTVCDWRDLPAVPRRTIQNTPPLQHVKQPCERNCSPAKLGKTSRRKRSRFSDLCANQKNDAENGIFVPRKRPCLSNHGKDEPETRRCEENARMRSSSEPSSQFEESPSKSPQHCSGRSSKTHISSPVSDSNTVCDDAYGNSSDGEPGRPDVRKQSQVKPSPLRNTSPNSSLSASPFERHVTLPMKDSNNTPRGTDNDSSDEETILRILRTQRNHFKTTEEGKCVSHNSNSTPNASFENLISSPVSVSSATPCNEADDSSDEEVIRRVPRRLRKPVKTSHSANCVSQSTTPASNASPKHFVSNSVSCSDRTSCQEADDSSDEETVLRGTRRQRRHKRTFSSGNDEERACSSTLATERVLRMCSSSDHEGHSVTSRKTPKKRTASLPSDEKRVKRRRTSTPAESDTRKQHKCRESSDLKYADSSVGPLSQDSTRGTELEAVPRGTSKRRAQRRRCPRQSTTRSVDVPWYLLDEERIPYRLRSSSRNCAARCIFWTKTERRLFKVAKSPIHNRGLYALEDIPAFAPVIEYAGEIVTQVRSEIREWEYQSRHIDEVYMYQLQKGTTDVIDGTKRGGPAKFVNHCCEPNVVADEIQAGGTNRVWFFSLRPIRKNEEILLDYCLSYEPGDAKRPCLCGARKCKKYLNYCGLTE